MENDVSVRQAQMDEPLGFGGKPPRLLCVEGSGFAARELLDAAAEVGIETMSLAPSIDDALRQALMGSPNIIVVPYFGDQVLQFLRAIEFMRATGFSPYVVLVADEDHGAVLEKCEGFCRISVLPLARVSQQLLPHLLRIAREIAPEA
jgi:hypothetical protein